MCKGLKRKCRSVFNDGARTSQKSPPRPPSPPDGPPRGTNFSRRKAVPPFPPCPPCTRILVRSINIQIESDAGSQTVRASRKNVLTVHRFFMRPPVPGQELQPDIR